MAAFAQRIRRCTADRSRRCTRGRCRAVAGFDRTRYGDRVGTPTNLADPDYEPTDEDLVQIAQEAFAGIATARAASLEATRARIAVLREQARSRTAECLRQHGVSPAGATP